MIGCSLVTEELYAIRRRLAELLNAAGQQVRFSGPMLRLQQPLRNMIDCCMIRYYSLVRVVISTVMICSSWLLQLIEIVCDAFSAWPFRQSFQSREFKNTHDCRESSTNEPRGTSVLSEFREHQQSCETCPRVLNKLTTKPS